MPNCMSTVSNGFGCSIGLKAHLLHCLGLPGLCLGMVAITLDCRYVQTVSSSCYRILQPSSLAAKLKQSLLLSVLPCYTVLGNRVARTRTHTRRHTCARTDMHTCIHARHCILQLIEAVDMTFVTAALSGTAAHDHHRRHQFHCGRDSRHTHASLHCKFRILVSVQRS